jgi:hypothetical protein
VTSLVPGAMPGSVADSVTGLTTPGGPLAHLRRMTDDGGLYEHALGTTPRPEHGYCLDDAARALVLLCRRPAHERDGDTLHAAYLTFVLEAQTSDGRFRNRRRTDHTWAGPATVEDCWGRAMYALGTATLASRDLAERTRTMEAFDRGAQWTSPHLRAIAYAGLGAAAVLTVRPAHAAAAALLAAAAAAVPTAPLVGSWRWPEPRLRYANAVLPEVLLAAGSLLDRRDLCDRGLAALDWLLTEETAGGHLSLTPVGGRGPGDSRPGFDQQPIEVAALADACARAYAVTGQPRWAEGVHLAAAWFEGSNDSGVPLADPISGGGCDGLERLGRNENQGAESTLALLSVRQQAAAITLVAVR